MDTLDTSAAPVCRFDIHAGAIHARDAWVLMPKILRSSESKALIPVGISDTRWDFGTFQIEILV